MKRFGLALLLMLAAAAPAQGAGMITHSFMGEKAIDYVTDPQLKALLDAHRAEVMAGAYYPDGGYITGTNYPDARGDYGEISHWEGFTNAYAEHVEGKSCGQRSDPAGPCASVIAHLMGVGAHGMGDEVWDWLFEPKMADFDERPEHAFTYHTAGKPGLAELGEGLADAPVIEAGSSSEYAMDMIGVMDHGRMSAVPPYAPPVADLVQVYDAIGADGITEDGIIAGTTAANALQAAERAVAPAEAMRVRETMPKSTAQYISGSGGVDYLARAIAGYYEALWAKVNGRDPAPRVVGTHFDDGETGVETNFQNPVQTSPGPVHGGAEKRIVAILSNAVQSESVTPQTFRVLDPAGRPVPPRDGFPQPGPYGGGAGTHTMMFYPAEDLKPCTRYTAIVTRGIKSFGRETHPERDFSWSFKTKRDTDAACPPDPQAPGGGSVPTSGPDLPDAPVAVGGSAPASAPAAQPAKPKAPSKAKKKAKAKKKKRAKRRSKKQKQRRKSRR